MSKEPINKKPLMGFRHFLGVFVVSVLIFIVLFFLGASGAVLAHKYNTSDRSLYGITFLGEDIGGLTEAELKVRISERLSQIRLVFKINGEVLEFTASQAGITFDESLIATQAFSARRSLQWHQDFLDGGYSFLHKHLEDYFPGFLGERREVVLASYQINNQILDRFIEELSQKYRIEETNASLVMNGSTVRVIPAIYGRKLVTSGVRAQIKSALKNGELTKISINTEEVDPRILESDVQKAILEAENILDTPVIFRYQERIFQPTKEVIGGWIVFTEKDGSLDPEVDLSKVKNYISEVLAKEINVAPINQAVRITNGRDREVTREGKDGLLVNIDFLANQVVLELNTKREIDIVVPTVVAKYKTEFNNVLVADWNQYIEVSIERQEMCAYLAGGEKVNCWKVTTGSAQWPTPRGTFLIMRKVRDECMPNLRTSDPNDRLCDVNYVSYFTSQGHAIHEAWWRSNIGSNAFGNPNFGINGSAGCVNATYEVARFIFNWAPLGTPVVVH